MFKREWTIFGILAACAIGVTLFARFYTRQDGTSVTWLTYVAAVAIFATLILGALLIFLYVTQRFNVLLQREHFVAQKQYQWADQKLLIDYDSQRLANTYIATRPVIPFSDVASFRIETYHVGARKELPADQCFVSLVIAITTDSVAGEYLYLPAYEVQVSSQDVQDVKEITAELLDKYPLLADMFALQQDVKKILEINSAN